MESETPEDAPYGVSGSGGGEVAAAAPQAADRGDRPAQDKSLWDNITIEFRVVPWACSHCSRPDAEHRWLTKKEFMSYGECVDICYARHMEREDKRYYWVYVPPVVKDPCDEEYMREISS